MRFLIKAAIVLLVLGGATAAGVIYLPPYLKQLYKTKYRHAEVTRGSIKSVVNATGEVKPVLSITVGSFVSGPIKHLYADFNLPVKEGDVLAEIDTRIYDANVARDEAQLKTRIAEIYRLKALVRQAENNKKRAIELDKLNKDYVSDAEMDNFIFSLKALEAQLQLAEAAVDQANANLNKSKTDLGFTEIKSPVDGVILDRKIDKGQTLAAAFQAPELFIVAPDLNKMHIHATVDEADIGLIAEAMRQSLPVKFTVDAYQDDIFTGKVYQIRKSSTTTQNVVTYPVIVECDNQLLPLPKEKQDRLDAVSGGALGMLGSPLGGAALFAPCGFYALKTEAAKLLTEFKLMPGMTASISFQVDEVKEKLRIPNSALRFYPDSKKVRKEDRKLLDGEQEKAEEDSESNKDMMSASDRAHLRRKRNIRHVWVEDGDFLKAIEVRTGLSNNKHTLLVTPPGQTPVLKEGQKLVTGIKTTN